MVLVAVVDRVADGGSRVGGDGFNRGDGVLCILICWLCYAGEVVHRLLDGRSRFGGCDVEVKWLWWWIDY